MHFVDDIRDAVAGAASGLGNWGRPNVPLPRRSLFWCSVHLRVHDPMTGLLAASEGRRRLSRLMKQRDGALLLVDIDGLARANYSLGPAETDSVIATAARLTQAAEPTALVCRPSGGEFVVAQTDTTRAERIAEDIRSRLEAAFGEKRIRVVAGTGHLPMVSVLTASIGLARFDKGARLDEVLRRAGEAMQTAKAQGRNRVVLAG